MNRLLADGALYTAANLLSRLASLATLAILPLLLDIHEYGIIGLVSAAGALVNILVPLEVSQGLARFYASTPEDEQPQIAGTAWWFTVLMLTGAAALGICLAPLLSRALFGTADYRSAFILAIAFWWGNCAFLFLQNQFRWGFRTWDYAAYSLMYAVALLSGAIGLALMTPDPLLGAIGGWALAALLVTALAYRTLRGSLPRSISGTHLRRMLRFALPLVPASIAVVVTTYFSRVILGSKVGLEDVGLFTFASQLSAIPSLVILGLQSAVTPHVMANFDRPETPALLARVFEVVVIAGLTGSTLLAIVSDSILPRIGYGEYVGAGGLILFLGPALLFQQLYIFAPGFAISHRTGQQALVSIASGVLAIVLNLFLIDRFGAWGAALATFVAATMFIGIWFALAQVQYRVPVNWPRLITAVLALIAASEMHFFVPRNWSVATSVIAIILVAAAAGGIWWPDIVRVLRPSNGTDCKAQS